METIFIQTKQMTSSWVTNNIYLLDDEVLAALVSQLYLHQKFPFGFQMNHNWQNITVRKIRFNCCDDDIILLVLYKLDYIIDYEWFRTEILTDY